MGTINILDSYKLRVDIDEHYIARIQRGLTGECDFASTPYTGVITKIYPEVANGRFAVDMVFTEEVPEQIRIGQTSTDQVATGRIQGRNPAYKRRILPDHRGTMGLCTG